MQTTYIWTVQALNCYPELEGYTDVVVTAYWTLQGINGDYAAAISDKTDIKLNPNSPYIPYADLTEGQVVLWILESMPESELNSYKERVEADLVIQQLPPIVVTPLPWIS